MKIPKQEDSTQNFMFHLLAFKYHWYDERNYLVPPVFLIPKVVKYIEKCMGKGVLVVPYWPSVVFWPLIFEARCTNYSKKMQNFL